MVWHSSFGWCGLTLALLLPNQADDSPRMTPAVKVIERIGAAIVPLFTQTAPNAIGSGTGVVIHDRGFILTADHVSQSYPGVALFGLQRVSYEVVGRLPERDLAILRVTEPSHVQASMSLGRSHDLKPGEPIIVGGNPGGRGIVYSQGNVSSVSIEPSWPNILVKSFWRSETNVADSLRARSTGGRPDYIQFDASSNRGNSGGPIVNIEGNLVGITLAKSFDEEGINWAIPVDRIRMLLPILVPAEAVGGFETGLELDMLAEQPLVESVREGSAAWKAGMRAGDRLLTVDGEPIRASADWLFALWGRKAEASIKVRYSRSNEDRECELKLQRIRSEEEPSRQDLRPGVAYRRLPGTFSHVPIFEKQPEIQEGVLDSLSIDTLATEEKGFAAIFQGFIELPEVDLYRIGLESDDGAKLYLNDRMVLDNDFAHPMQRLSRWIHTSQKLIPFRLEYFDAGGDRGLKLSVSRDVEGKDPVAFRVLTEHPSDK